jgi:hypothetical protein
MEGSTVEASSCKESNVPTASTDIPPRKVSTHNLKQQPNSQLLLQQQCHVARPSAASFPSHLQHSEMPPHNSPTGNSNAFKPSSAFRGLQLKVSASLSPFNPKRCASHNNHIPARVGKHCPKALSILRQDSSDSINLDISLPQGKAAVTVVDMGIHKVRGSAEPLQLLTVLPPGLEGRGHFYPPLNTLQQYTPGYFNAPGASAAPLQPPKKQMRQDNISFCYSPSPSAVCDLPPVVMVFCAVDNYQSMLTANRCAMQQMY